MSGEERELVAERELVELFRPRRPAPDAFRAGVERRIAEKQREAAQRAEEERRAPLKAKILRRVAALFPGDPLGGAAIGGATAKLAGVKLLPAVLAVPALLLGSTIGAFAAGARSLLRSTRTAAPNDEEQEGPIHGDILWARRVYRRLMRFGWLLMLVVWIAFGGRWLIEVLILASLVSMCAVVITVRGLARSGTLTRTRVAFACWRLLGALVVGFLIFAVSSHLQDPDSDLGIGWSVLTVIVGGGVCEVIAHWQKRGPWAQVWRCLCLAFLGLVINPSGVTRSSPEDLRHWLAHVDPEAERVEWPAIVATFDALNAVHAQPADLTSLEGFVARRLEDRSLNGVELTAAAHMGLIHTEQWRKLASSDEPDVLSRFLEKEEYTLQLLQATQAFGHEQRDQLATRVAERWPGPDDGDILEKAARVMQLFDLLDHPDMVEAHKAEALELLRRCWVASNFWDRDGGFGSEPGDKTSSPDPTWAAIALMARLGVPDGIDVRLLRGSLHAECRILGFPFEFESNSRALERASLMLLEYKIGLPPRTWVEAVLGERLLIASILIVVLCLVAIRLTPPESVESHGAQP